MSFKHNIRERLNIFLYASKEKVLITLKFLNLFTSLVALGSLVYYYGFPHTPDTKELLLTVIRSSFAFYVLMYFIKLLYDFHPWKYIKKTWFEAVIMVLLIVEGVHFQIYGDLLIPRMFNKIGIDHFADYSNLIIQLYFLLVVVIELSRSAGFVKLKLSPAILFILSFLLIISGGMGLLMLPEMTTAGHMNFLDAFFTSTSASCVTGLIVEDTATFFTFKGQMVLLVLIKLGGLNIIAFASFIAIAGKLGIGIKHDNTLEDYINKDNVLSGNGMLSRVIIWSVIIEILGSIVLFLFWNENIPFKSVGDKVFSSIFHSVSAFNNAGLSNFSDGLGNDLLKNNYMVHNAISLLVFFGALGFMAIFDLFGIQRLRDRMKRPWKQIQFSTKIALYFSLALVLIGTVGYYFLEYDNTLQGQSGFGKFTTSLFQSITRTSGFNTVDVRSIGLPMLMLLTVLMFIGSSSSSTGGGIKTSTLAILWASTISTIRGKKNIELYKRTISNDLVLRTFSVLLFFLMGNLICIFILSITEQSILAEQGRGIMDLIFEEVSAFGTVGLSTGITSQLSDAGKIVIIVSMFVGRVGTLTVAFAFGNRTSSTNYKYPTGHTMVG